MALKSPLGFGMMRLPVLSDDPTDFNYPELDQMVDAFLDAGYTYFDTSYVYHNGKSEEATRKAIVERHPRDSFTIATKFPSFAIKSEEEIEPIFEQQLKNLGVDTIDYYLIHNVQTVTYEGIDGKDGIIKTTHLFDHAREWKKQGKIRNLGFSLHSSAAQLDRVLQQEEGIDFVQLAINYIDWNSGFVQAGPCYEVARKYGKKIVVMEPVKGGGLSKVPAAVQAALEKMAPEETPAEWALRFAGTLDGVLCILSGMSTLQQVQQNIETFRGLDPLTAAQMHKLESGIAEEYRDAGPLGGDMSAYDGKTLHGVPVGAILEAYSVCQLQPDPGFSDDNNYLKNMAAENAHIDIFGKLPEERIVLEDGRDVTAEVLKAEDWLIKHSF